MSKADKGVLIIVSGFAGAGKGTVVRMLLDTYPDRFKLSVSATTRAPRPGEVDGIHYFFKTHKEFEEMIERTELLEYARYVGNYYGTPRDYVKAQLDAGYDVILEIEQQGAFQVKDRMPEAVLVFLTPPSAAELESRLRGRGTETEPVIMSRLARAAVEAENIDRYDYILYNENGESYVCMERLNQIIQSERARTTINKDKIKVLQDQLQIYREGE